MSDESATTTPATRRAFLRTASLLAAGGAAAATAGCDAVSSDPSSHRTPGERPLDATTVATRGAALDGERLLALAEVMLPAALGADGIRRATDAFVAWIAGYDPVAEEMHGYGYAEVRYLPPDPLPGWRAQLDALELLSQRTRRKAFASLDAAGRSAIVTAALRRERGGDRLPAPLAASHVAIALVAHWASSPDAWNRALGASVSPSTCRPLAGATRDPSGARA